MNKVNGGEQKLYKSLRNSFAQKTAQASHIIQSIAISGGLQIAAFLGLQKICGTLLPLLIILQVQFGSHQILHTDFLPYKSIYNNNLIFQFLLFVINLLPYICLVCIQKQSLIFRKILGFLIIVYALNPLLLIMSSSPFSFQDASLFMKSLAVGNLILTLISSITFMVLISRLSLVNDNSIGCHFSWTYFFAEMSLRIGCFFATMLGETYGDQQRAPESQKIGALFFVGLCLIRQALSLVQQIKDFTYFDPQTSSIHRKILCCEFGLALTSLFSLITNEAIIIDNFWLLSLSLGVFSAIALKRYINHRDQEFEFLLPSELDTPQEAILYLKHTHYTLFKNKVQGNSKNSVIFSTLKKQHQEKCQEKGCQCRKTLIPIQFYHKLYAYCLKQLLRNFKKQSGLVVFIAFYKLDILQVFASTSLDLLKVRQNAEDNLFLDIQLRKFEMKLGDFIEKKCQEQRTAKTQKVYYADKFANLILKKWRKIIGLKHQFWAHLHKEISEREKFLKNINDQLKLQKNFHQDAQQIITDFPNSEILITQILIYEKIILLKPHLHKELTEKIATLRNKNRKVIFRNNMSSHSSEIEKYMFGAQCCTIQAKISSEDTGIIVHASKNVENIFGHKPKNLEGLNINKIIPHSMREEHDKLFENWVKSGQWVNIGTVRHIYALNKNQSYFCLAIYLKLIQTKIGVNIVASCFDDNNKDFMIINGEGVIDGASNKFTKILGDRIIGIPLNMISNIKLRTISPDKDLWGKNQCIGEFYPDSQKEKEMEEFNHLKGKFKSERSGLEDKKSDHSNPGLSAPISIQYELQKYRMGGLKFTLLHLVRVCSQKAKKSQQMVRSQPRKIFQKFADSFVSLEGLEKQDRNSFIERNEEEDRFLDCGTSSVGRSIASDNFTAESAIVKLEDQYLNPEKIKQRRALKITVIGILLCFLTIAVTEVKLNINIKGYSEIEQLFFADGACSDNMQLLEFMYNKMMSMRLYRGLPEFQEILQSAEFEHSYVQGLISQQVKNMQLFKTSLIGQKYYVYQLNEVSWKLPKGKNVTITETQFMTNLIQLSLNYLKQRGMRKTSLGNAASKDLTLEEELFYLNFPQMKQINHYNLQLYLDMSKNTIMTIRMIGILKLLSSIVIMGLIVLIFHKHYMYRFFQEKILWEEFGAISKPNCLAMRIYYSRLLKTFEKHSGGKENELKMTANINGINISQVEAHYAEFNGALDDLNIENEVRPSRNFKVMGGINKSWLVGFGIGFAFVCILNMTIYLWDSSILDVCTGMMKNINGLMDSQNYILEAYFDFKSEFILKDPAFRGNQRLKPIDISVLGKKLLHDMDQNQVIFNIVATQSLEIFASYDSKYLADMSYLLTKNLCALEKEVLPAFLIEKCMTEMELKILERGLINSMNLFQRNVANAIHGLLKDAKDIEQNDSPTEASVRQKWKTKLMSKQFKEIDYSIFYMFKMYQGTQARITKSLKNTLLSHFKKSLVAIHLQLLYFSGIIVYSVLFYYWQRQKSANINGYCSLVPVRIVKSNKKMVKDFARIADLSVID